MNGIPINALLSPILIALSVAMMVGAARHKNASGKVRGGTMIAGVVILAFSLGNLAFSRTGSEDFGWAPGAVLISAFLGAFVGYWVGHTSRPAQR